MRTLGRRLDFNNPRVVLLGCVFIFFLVWIGATAWSAPPHAQSAFATFLTAPYVKEGQNSTEIEDGYYLGARVLIHRLMHSENAGTHPVIVMVTEDVAMEKRKRLEKDGARVIAVPAIEPPEWMEPNEPRWHHMLTKLKLFDLTEYDKICYMDSDMLIMKNMDLIFETEAVKEKETKTSADRASDEAPLPERYTMAALTDSYGYKHPFSLPFYFNAGFMVFKPSRTLYEYYISLTKIQDRFKTGMMEQDLLNYAHRPDGNMPWEKLWEKWNIDHAVEDDWQKGVLSFHDKYWEYSEERNPRFLALWNQHLGEMNSYWRVVEQGRARPVGRNGFKLWS